MSGTSDLLLSEAACGDIAIHSPDKLVQASLLSTSTALSSHRHAGLDLLERGPELRLEAASHVRRPYARTNAPDDLTVRTPQRLTLRQRWRVGCRALGTTWLTCLNSGLSCEGGTASRRCSWLSSDMGRTSGKHVRLGNSALMDSRIYMQCKAFTSVLGCQLIARVSLPILVSALGPPMGFHSHKKLLRCLHAESCTGVSAQ